MTDVVAVANKTELDALELAKHLFQGDKIRQCLTRMQLFTERVDQRNGGILRHRRQGIVLINPGDNTLHPDRQILGVILGRFAGTDTLLFVVDVHRMTTKLGDADLKADPCPQTRFLKQQRKTVTFQCAGKRLRLLLCPDRQINHAFGFGRTEFQSGQVMLCHGVASSFCRHLAAVHGYGW